ncbi:SAM-dependent methyltransferase [Winogradskya consettensis]|uniref:S-adenosyl methyltransferase n=1 Tax=Winogradskya consettensis TaxID=113560 RepID=A0A919VLQ9_9ACTN|nr:SAM-dependent methyltransferase [Actinoplanes consettensis]GIM67944.1 hypothetical protein Aco04nite_08510 [Actinoplanes consettensis]
MALPAWAGDGIDVTRPSVARVYDYYLGGVHHFDADRAMAEKAIADWPDLPLIMRSNRAFLRRAVTYLARAGIRQFLDIGSGIPTAGNVHEIAQNLAPESRIVYVDTDPVAVTHSRALLAGNPTTAVLAADFTRPGELLTSVRDLGLLDPQRPTAVLLNALLHFIPDSAQPGEAIATLRDALAPGSYLVISHATHELHPADLTDRHRDLYRTSTASRMTMRGRTQVEAFFDGFDLVEPSVDRVETGIVLSERWHPDETTSPAQADRFPIWVGVGFRP